MYHQSSPAFIIVFSYRQAEITLKLRNRGTDAYKPADYGPTIVVVRQIKDDGTTSYKLKSNKGTCDT